MQGPEGSAGGGAAADAPPDGAAAGRGGPSRGYERTAEKASRQCPSLAAWPAAAVLDQYERMVAKASPSVPSRALGDGADMWLHAVAKVSILGAGSSSSPW
mmetsp:Transcript_71972/g.203248  ORF Transcript_71972/g.203248 Transcript_71972/m.203248 type:complete len:101 (+) Transcript_71972:85-387(+)